jgi:hypothetical protein
MTQDQEISPPSDVCLLLRAHAEQHWLSHEVGPVLRQLRLRDELPEEQLGAALAYLEVLWIEASQRAAETDAAYAEFEASERAARADEAHAAEPEVATRATGGWTLPSKARRYRVAVLTLRDVFGRQVAAMLAATDATPEHAGY